MCVHPYLYTTHVHILRASHFNTPNLDIWKTGVFVYWGMEVTSNFKIEENDYPWLGNGETEFALQEVNKWAPGEGGPAPPDWRAHFSASAPAGALPHAFPAGERLSKEARNILTSENTQ